MKSSKTDELKQMIEGAIRFASPNMRTKALKACQWRLRGPHGEYVGAGPAAQGLPCRFVPESKALVFDGRDNEDMKLAVFECALGALTVEIIPQIP